MKMSKTILPALAMLLVSAIMLSTASFAWFVMSSEATANNMQVGIKSDSAFLVISDDPNDIKGNYQATTFTFATPDTQNKISPTALDLDALDAAIATEGVNILNAPLMDNVWYTMSGTTSTNGSGSGNKQYIYGTESEGNTNVRNINNYVKMYTVYVGVAPMAEQTMEDLLATVTLTGDPSIGVLIVGPTGYVHYLNGNAVMQDFANPPAAGTYNGGVLAETLNNTSSVQVNIYIYYNGDHSHITNDDLANGRIKDATVSVTFTATAP